MIFARLSFGGFLSKNKKEFERIALPGMAKQAPHKPLAQTFMFWLALVIPIFFGVVLSFLIYRDSSVGGFCFTPGCMTYFLELYRLPIAICGLALPFVAMIASLHRSKEAFLQIMVGQAQYSEALKNNIFGNYLKHRDGFFDVIDRFIAEESNDIVCLKVDSAALYGAIFHLTVSRVLSSLVMVSTGRGCAAQ